MVVFNEELLKFWRALQQNDVLYIMVGGVATNLHGYHRTTDDIDVWIKDTLGNRQNLRKDVSVPFLHINHLLANKKAVNRPKDQVDVIELERIKEITKSNDQSDR